MAKGPGPALLLAGVAALFLLKGKKGDGGAAEPKSDDPESPTGEKEKPDTGTPKAPKAKTQEELEEEYVDEDDGVDEEFVPEEEIVAEALWKKWPAGSELGSPGVQYGHQVMYVSEDCEAALIGRDWEPVIEFKEKLYDPASFWREFADGMRPNEVIEELGVSNVRWFTDKLLKNRGVYIECEVEVPKRGDYASDEEYGNAWTAYLNASRAFAHLFHEIYDRHVKYPMMSAWAQDDPDAYMDYQLFEMAEWAVDKYPNEDVTEQTDQAYFNWIEDIEGAPKVLDPDNPAHEDFIDLWVQLNEAIKSL